MKTVRRWHMFVDTYSIGSREACEVEPAEMEDGEWVKYEDIKHLLQGKPAPSLQPDDACGLEGGGLMATRIDVTNAQLGEMPDGPVTLGGPPIGKY